MRAIRRQRKFVDASIQGALVFRILGYWLYCLLAVFLLNCCWVTVTVRPASSSQLFNIVSNQIGPSLIATLILIPIVIMDVIRFSNRFVGPLVRLRREMSNLAVGEPSCPLEFRENDYWSDLGADFNRIRARQINVAFPKSHTQAAASLAERV